MLISYFAMFFSLSGIILNIRKNSIETSNNWNIGAGKKIINNIIEIIIICSKLNKNNYTNYNDINNETFIFASSGQIIHSLIDKITTIVIKKKYNADKLFVNICTITDILMILVNKNIYLINIEKKNIIIQAFTKFFVEKI